jgi:Protein of unknown function (DUF3987)
MSTRVYSATERAADADGTREEEKIPDFPAEYLPQVLEKQARAIAELCRVPLGMAAPMILATASASIGRGLRVRSRPGLITPANLYILVCKTSGSGGSVTFRHATAPFVGIQKTLRREFEENEKPRLDAEQIDISQQLDEAKRSLKGAAGEERDEILNRLTSCNQKLAELEKRRSGKLLFATDVTPEKLAEMLAHNGETLAHFDSDAADALGIILGTRYGDGAHAQDSLWLKSYTGEPHAIFRKNSEAVHLDAPCLAVLFVTTPDKVQELYRTPRLTAGGLLPRFLACDPDARPMPLDFERIESPTFLPTDAAQPYEAAIFSAVNFYRLSSNDEPDEIEVTPEALRLIIDDWNRFCAVATAGADAPFEARHTENAIRIALVLHVFRHCEIEQRGAGTYGARMHGHEHDLDAETMRNALRVRDWFNAHQERLRAPERVAADDSAWERAEAVMRSMPAGITARDFYNGGRVCHDATTARRLLAQWQEQGRVVSFERKPEGAGRPTTAYKIAPKVRGL